MACRDIHEVRHLGVLMGYCDHQMHRLMTKKLRQYDVSPMQCRTLTYLQEAEGQVNQRMLEQHLMVKPSTPPPAASWAGWRRRGWCAARPATATAAAAFWR